MTDDLNKIEETHEPEEAPKPPSVPLFQIPDAVLNSMSKEVTPDTAMLNNPVEWIMKQRKMAEVQVQPESNVAPQVAPAITVPQPVKKKEKTPTVAWAGKDVTDDALVMLFYTVVKEASKDKKLKKYLKDLKVEIYDVNDELLWP